MVNTLTLQIIMWLLVRNFDIDFSYLYYLIYVIPVACITYLIYYKWNIKKEQPNEDYLVISFCDEGSINNFTEYVKHNKQYYNIMINTNAGDINKLHELQIYLSGASLNATMRDMIQREAYLVTQSLDTKITFDDKYLGIKGYYVWKRSEKKVSDSEGKITRDVTLKYIEFNILKELNKQIEPLEIIDKIKNYVSDLKKDKIKLYYYKYLSDGPDKEPYIHSVNIFDGKKQPFEQLETRFIKTMFHQEKDRLWSMVKNSCLNQHLYKDKGQCGRVSLLLYGPPGTGKSSFSYRVAMCLNRSLISLDLRDLSKQRLYQILQNPRNSVGGTYKDYVYLFEEIDASITELYLRGQKQQSAKSDYENRMMSYYGGYGSMRSMFGDDDMYYGGMKTKKSSQYTIKDKDTKIDDEKTDENKTDSSVTDIEPAKEKTKEEKDKETKNITDKYTSQYDSIRKLTQVRNEFSIRDLLEIFQGPVSLESSVIIANTNKFDEIQKMCPELFRYGRLTPVYFGYINKDTMQDISTYYFGQKIKEYLPETIKISTSEIIDLAMETSSLENEADRFPQFSQRLNKLIDNIKD